MSVPEFVDRSSYYMDKGYGRKFAFFINLLVFVVGACSSLSAQSPLVFALLKFLGSITCLWEICYTWALEFVGPSQRTALTTMLSVIYCVATMLLALLAYLCNTWVEFGLCTSAPFALLFSYGFFIPESPRWLLTQGRIDEALRIIENMARWQKVKIDHVALREAITGKKSAISTVTVGVPNSTSSSSATLLPNDQLNKEEFNLKLTKNPIVVFIDDVQSTSSSEGSENSATKLIGTAAFLSSSNLRWKSFVLTAIEIVANQLYYAIPYSLENLSANFYVSYVLQAAVEAPATLINLFLLNRFGRVVPLSVSLFLSGFCCLLTLAGGTLFGDFSYGPVILVVASRFFICTAVAIVEQLGGELFPTVARGTGQGVSYFLSSLASISTQYILYASHVWAGFPMLIFGSMIVVVSFMTLFLPETMGKSLPDTIRQAEAQGSVGWTSFKRNLPILTKFFCKRFKKRKMYRLSANGLTSANLLPKSIA
uniref:Major facilitator superfamily (MFS) profile domain-containing protein n=1 Tax=Romanomermis culicivorax TaxID=13658 RepID=A0A915K243_ROMCU